MESVTHSRQPNKISNGGFSGKSLYDDVYGGPPPKFGASTGLSPRFEDYGEIFGSFRTRRASSIPVLDLPVVDDAEAFFDPRSSAFSYSEVFGALDYHDLLHQPNGLDGVSSEEAWTPAETDSFSGESDHSANNQSMSNQDLFQSVDGITEFDILYQKVNGTSNQYMSKGKTQMSHLRAVPGFTLFYDETTQSHKTDPSFQVADDIDPEMEFTADKVKQYHPRKTMPNLRNFTSGEQTFGNDLNLHNGCSRNGSHSGEMFITVSDISLRSMPSLVPPPSRPPPVLDAKRGDTCGFHAKSGRVASGETPDDSLTPLFDVEVDMNSSAAASAAAMKEAMHKAEAKLRSAKELKERKKGVYESCIKSNYDVKNNEAKMNKNMSRLNSLNDEKMQETYDRRHSNLKIPVTAERQKSRNASPETPDTLEGKRILNVFEEKNMKESRSSQESDGSSGVETWKEETEFFELVGTEESVKLIQPTNPTEILVQDTRTDECGWKEREAYNMQEEYIKVKAIEENYQVEEYERKSRAAREAYDHNKNIMGSKASNEESRQREHLEKKKVAKIFEHEENEKNRRMVHQHGKTEKEETEAIQSESSEDVSEMQQLGHKQVGIEKSKEVDRQTPSEVQLDVRLKENEKKLNEVEKQQQSVKRNKQSERMKENRPGHREAFALGQAEEEVKLKDSVEVEDFVERSNGAFKQNDTEEKEACKREIEMRLKLAKHIQIKKGLKVAHGREEIEKIIEGSSIKAESDEGLKHTLGWEEDEKLLQEEFELEVNEIKLEEAFKQHGNDERENEAYERDQNKSKFIEVSDGMLSEAQWKREIDRPSIQTFDTEGSVKVSNEDIHPEHLENMDKDVSRMGKDEGLDKAFSQMEGNEEEDNMKFAKATDETWETENDEILLATLSVSIHEENIGKMEVSQESLADQENGKTRTECKFRENKLEEIGVENQLTNKKIREPEMMPGDAEHSVSHSRKEDGRVMKDDYRRSTEAAETAKVQESVNIQKTNQWFHVGQSTERKEKSLYETPVSVVKDADRMRRERESEKDHLRKIEEERVREKDRMAVDKTVLEVEREREREKDRMAVDRATFEARDRAYAEACERAERAAFERATAEARQRALAEARERLEKACAEARDKSYADKRTTEARLKTERAAVERATAEAQERAMEKLKVERAAFESGERLERSVSDKIGVCFRGGGRQDSSSPDMLDPQFQNFGSSAGSRHPYSLYGASSFSERSEREGESARRCRARLERHRRTAERAAKALAEKNMRDLQAQKEQAERNRLAETLDAEVRRWSSGKEGNLRALLSTLQYILGPDCGWQAIPLTEVITSANVKKAYRKATLCVHPDKLQQRGASIQHKYICEKVFDLLKEAWNKFNSEER